MQSNQILGLMYSNEGLQGIVVAKALFPWQINHEKWGKIKFCNF
jgi:hypothetical protein